MKNKKDLWIVAIALVSVLFIAILLVASGALKSDTKEESQEVVTLEEEVSQENKEVHEEPEIPAAEEGFAEQYGKELPEGYRFSKTMTANPERDDRMQLDILDEDGMSTDVAIVFDTEEAGSQMALTMKDDCFADDADVLLKWYLFTFLEGFTEEKTKTVYDNYLYMFDTGSQDYRVYTEESVTVMMSLEAEESGNYYYVMIARK